MRREAQLDFYPAEVRLPGIQPYGGQVVRGLEPAEWLRRFEIELAVPVGVDERSRQVAVRGESGEGEVSDRIEGDRLEYPVARKDIRAAREGIDGVQTDNHLALDPFGELDGAFQGETALSGRGHDGCHQDGRDEGKPLHHDSPLRMDLEAGTGGLR